MTSGCRSEPPPLRITFLDVGQGDSIVLESPGGRVVVIDGGGIPGTDESAGGDPGNRIVVPYLRSRGITNIDLLVATHSDEDHVQGLIAVTERLNVRAVLHSGLEMGKGASRRLLTHLQSRRLPLYPARRGEQIPLGNGARLDILHPESETKRLTGTRSDDNNNAIVLRVVYRDVAVLLTADAEEEAEMALLRSRQDLHADVLKLGHHGSRFSTSARFLRAVSPKFAVLSCGRENRFGHPHKEVLQRLTAQKVALYRTDQQGAVTVETDGKTLRFLH